MNAGADGNLKRRDDMNNDQYLQMNDFGFYSERTKEVSIHSDIQAKPIR